MRHFRTSQAQLFSCAIAITLSSSFLAGCSLGAASSETTNQSAATDSGAPESSTVDVDVSVPASFDPKDPNFRLFDPCTELPEDVLRKAGLGERVDLSSGSGSNYKTCGFRISKESSPGGMVQLATNTASKEVLNEHAFLVEKPEIGAQVAYFYRQSRDSLEQCSAVAQTSGGQFDVTYIEPFETRTNETLCDEAWTFLTNLYPEVQKRAVDGLRKDR